MLVALAMIAVQTDPLIERASAATRAEPGCVIDPNSTDVTVCGLRRADRYRVPLVVHDPGDRRYESVRAERTRLLNRTTPLQDLGPFQVGGGMAGVSVKTTFGGPGGGTAGGGLRRMAP